MSRITRRAIAATVALTAGSSLAAIGLIATPAFARGCPTGDVCVYANSNYTGAEVDFVPSTNPTTFTFDVHGVVNESASSVNLYDSNYNVILTVAAGNLTGFTNPGVIAAGEGTTNHNEILVD